MTRRPRPVPMVVCADDYGLTPGIGRAIRDLIGGGRLSATSCMTVCPPWAEEAKALRPLADRADVGLHLTLTDHAPLGALPRLAPQGRLPPLGALMRMAFSGGLDAGEIAAEVDRQVAAFVRHFGQAPAFIDGHQHVHQLPVVREAVVAALARLPGGWVRVCREPRRAILRRGVAVAKALLIAELGSGLEALAAAAGTPFNRSFRGVYDFSGRVPFPTLMERFIEPPSDGALLMVHPGIPDDSLRGLDPVVEQRGVEHAYLSGPAFASLLERRNIAIARLNPA